MIDYMKNMLIGLFVVVACGLVVGIILFLEPTVGDGKEKLIVRFSNVNGLSVGTRVMFAGKPVGEVVTIEQIPNAREQPTDEMGQVYFYQLTLHLDSSVVVYNTDEVTLQTSGLLGEKSITIVPKAPPKGVKPSLISDSTPIYAESVDPLESAFREFSQVSEKVEDLLDKVTVWIDQNSHEVSDTIRSLNDVMTEATITLAHVNKIDLVDDVQSAIQNFSKTMRGVYNTIDQLSEDGAFVNLSQTLKHLKGLTKSLETIGMQLSSGKGSIGQLLMNDETYLRFTSILTKVNTLMNDVNQYGVFFNLNKKWQRTRVKQVNFLDALTSPTNFRNYFSREVDLISTSMTRLSMLVDQAEEHASKEKLLNSDSFKKDFSDLMRQTQALYDNLKLYNEQLTDLNQTGS